jgi:hypothetical protein
MENFGDIPGLCNKDGIFPLIVYLDKMDFAQI